MTKDEATTVFSNIGEDTTSSKSEFALDSAGPFD